jgi:hypothetical protein
MSKEIEITQEEFIDEVDEITPGPKDELFRITVPMRPGQITQTRVISHFNFPFPSVSMQCDDPKSRCWISEVNGSTIRIKARVGKKSKKDSAILYVRVTDGLPARRHPN